MMFGARSTAIKAGEDLGRKIMLERSKKMKQRGPAPRPNIYYYETASEVDNIVSSAPKRRKPPIRALSPLRGIRSRRSAYQQKRHSSSSSSSSSSSGEHSSFGADDSSVSVVSSLTMDSDIVAQTDREQKEPEHEKRGLFSERRNRPNNNNSQMSATEAKANTADGAVQTTPKEAVSNAAKSRDIFI